MTREPAGYPPLEDIGVVGPGQSVVLSGEHLHVVPAGEFDIESWASAAGNGQGASGHLHGNQR